jgi:hypothetical protein
MKKKMPDKEIKKRKDDMQEYMHVMLSVLSKENDEPEDCPDPENLAAFAEGRLTGDERKAIMGHVNCCTACRRHWLMIQSVMEEMSPVKATWKERILHMLKKILRYRLFAGTGIGIAVTTCLFLIVMWPQKDELPQMITESTMRLSPSDIARYNSFVNKGAPNSLGQLQSEMMSESHMDRLPDDMPRYNPYVDGDKDKELEKLQPQPQLRSPLPSAAWSAYKDGIAAGRSRFLDQTEATHEVADHEAQVPVLNSLGQWVVVLQCACIAEEPVSEKFWSDQEMIALQLQDDIKNSAIGEIEGHLLVQTVMTMQDTVGQIRASGEQAKGCENIKTAIESLEDQLSSTPNLPN